MTPDEYLFPSETRELDEQHVLLAKFQQDFNERVQKVQSVVRASQKQIRRLRPLREAQPCTEDYLQILEQYAKYATDRDYAEEWLATHEDVGADILYVEPSRIDTDDPRINPLWQDFLVRKAKEQVRHERDDSFFAAEQEHEST